MVDGGVPLLLRGWPECQHLDQPGSEIRFEVRFLVLLQIGGPGNKEGAIKRLTGKHQELWRSIYVPLDPTSLPATDKSLDRSSTRSNHQSLLASLGHGKEKPHCGKHAKPVPRSASADLRDDISKYNAYPATMGGKLLDVGVPGTDCICENPCLGWRESNVGLNAFAAADRRVPSGSFHGSILPVCVG